ncbi:MAG TPA: hypothetical protein VH183_09030 [Burkholderiaceae bacterium]|jgi:hypothetical protein|nr:hypothetical protein [Burkholderiaceae bacterium]
MPLSPDASTIDEQHPAAASASNPFLQFVAPEVFQKLVASVEHRTGAGRLVAPLNIRGQGSAGVNGADKSSENDENDD